MVLSLTEMRKRSNEFIREMSLEYACNPYNEIEYLNTNQYKELRKEYSFWESKFKSL